MIRVKWDVEELVALIALYDRCFDMDPTFVEGELLKFSKTLNKRADQLGIKHDEKFRNLNGMKMQYQNIVYIASHGENGLSSASHGMFAVYKMKKDNPEVFSMLLEEFNRKYLI